MNAVGRKVVLNIGQKKDTITGKMTGINNEDMNANNGTEITFTREGGKQECRGYLFVNDPARKADNQAMSGVCKDGEFPFGRYAKRWPSRQAILIRTD